MTQPPRQKSSPRPRMRAEWLVTLPPLVWLVLFFVIPTALVVAIAFKPVDLDGGGIGPGWTLDTIRSVGQGDHLLVFLRTVAMALANTLLCLLLGIPVGYWLARLAPARRSWALLLIMLPFWTNYLIRIFAWLSILRFEGPLKYILTSLHLVPSDAQLLYNNGAVLLVHVYTYLPFAILPIYAAAEKFDFSLMEAAMDLGASRFRAFRSVFLPGIGVGLVTAVLVVFVPTLGSYAIPDLVGGHDNEMLGNVIYRRAFSDRNLPHASALATLLVLFALAPMIVYLLRQSRSDQAHQPGVGPRRTPKPDSGEPAKP